MRNLIKIRLLKNILEEVTRNYDYFISQQEQLLKRTFELSIKDPLTGLYNRNYLEDYSQKAFSRISRHNTNLVLIFIDLDNFKQVNDTFGHETGDEVLKKVSEILRDIFRKYDIIVRYGGDEFIVLIEDLKCDEKAIKNLLEKMVKRIEENLKKFKISASYGMAIAPKEADNLKDLIFLADERMYKQKIKRKKAR